jgi:predicted transposase/invertase (TIGR01784 family)
MDEDIKAADAKFNELLSDEKAFHDYQMRQLAKMELESELNYREEKGIKEGKIEGKLEVAVNLLSKGMELDLVSEITNIPIAKLKSLKH